MTETAPTSRLAETHDTYISAFEQIQREGAVSPAMKALRHRAFTNFLALGFPTTKLERWRFTNVAPITQTSFELSQPVEVPASDLTEYDIENEAGGRVVFVNGRFVPSLSQQQQFPDGVSVRSLAELLETDPTHVESYLGRLASFEADAFTALNTALLHDGVVVQIAPRTVVEAPIHALFITTANVPVMSHPRVLLLAGENSEVRFVESYAGLDEAPYFTNAVTEVIASEGAVIDHYKLLRDSQQSYHIARMQLRLARSVNFSSHSVTLGGALVRNDVEAELAGEGVECTLNGLYLVSGRRIVDNHTTIRHAKPNCVSHELYKGILDDHAHAVFNGKIIVDIDAQKTNAKQTNRALLLSEDAQINTKPELEIFADDVKCTHGATVGQLDKDSLFYLRSRGLSFDQARSVLIHAFANDLINRIAIPSIRAKLDAVLLQQLPGTGGKNFYE